MPPAAADSKPAPDQRCPCLSGSVFAECCEPLISGERDAPTAVQLMRSRFTAYAIGARDYLLATWHPSTRPASLELDGSVRWYRLDVLRTERGGPLDRAGTVEFRAAYRAGSDRGELHETSRFTREGRRWYYVDGDS
jgi:SEC-C motif-containing protein